MSRHDKQVDVALRRGRCVSKNLNTEIEFTDSVRLVDTFEGPETIPVPKEIRVVSTFEGPRTFASGILEFRHFGTDVMVVDMTRQLITDNGFTGYSMTTNRNIRGWSAAMHKLGLAPAPWCWPQWTKKAGDPRSPYEVFRTKVPWVRFEFARVWFHWPSYDEVLSDQYWESLRFLHDQQNWRYFKFGWTDDGRWDKQFIDEDAVRRWKARETRHKRKKR